MAGLPSIPTVAGNPCFDHGCTACCHDSDMLLTEADLARLRHVRPADDFWVEDDDGFIQLRARAGPPLAGATGARCIFLADDGRCSVHEARPAGCRLYPAVWDVDEARAFLDEENCPHTDGFRLPRATADAVARLVEHLHAERRARMHRRAKSP